MNQIAKILIAVISACCALVLVYFLVTKLNNVESGHPKDVGPKVNGSSHQNYTLKNAHSNEAAGNSNDQIKPTNLPSENLENLKMHKNFRLFNNPKCGVHTGVHKIHNGKITELKANPWMVALVYFNNATNTTSVDCAGTLISENLVLTAAHCLRRTPIAVRLGDYNLASDPDCVTNKDMELECAEKAQEITDFKALRHEHHWAQVFEDIALIKLNEPAKLQQDNINTICLPFDLENNFDVNNDFYITGWGRIDNNNTFSDVLLGTYVEYITHDDCRKTITSTLTRGHICAGSDDGSDSCRGDSGGPLIQLRYLDSKIKAVQFGIVSYGPSGDCGKGPGVYTNVHRYLNWILKNAEV